MDPNSSQSIRIQAAIKGLAAREIGAEKEKRGLSNTFHECIMREIQWKSTNNLAPSAERPLEGPGRG